MPQGQSFKEAHAGPLAEIAELAGVQVGDVFLYSEHPGDGNVKYVFQSWIDDIPVSGVQTVCKSVLKANANVAAVLAWCRANPDKAKELTEGYRA